MTIVEISKINFQSSFVVTRALCCVGLEIKGTLFSRIATEYANQVNIAQLINTTATMMKLVLVWGSRVGCKSA